MKTSRNVFLLSILVSASSTVSAFCYTVISQGNKMVYRATGAPIKLSTRISESLPEKYPGGHLIVKPDDSDSDCPHENEILTEDKTDAPPVERQDAYGKSTRQPYQKRPFSCWVIFAPLTWFLNIEH